MIHKILLVILVILILVTPLTVVMAGGGQVQGRTGNGKGDQNTVENGCTVQPCATENADQPQYNRP